LRDKFVIRLLHDPNDRSIEPMYALMVQELSEEEAEIPEWIRHTIAERLYWYHVVETRDGKLIAFSSTQYLELKPLQSADTSPQESFFVVWFIVIDPEFRRRGLAHTLYERFFCDARTEAQARGQRLKAIIGEVVEPLEAFLNRMGRKRIYFTDEQSDVHEVPYLAPPIDMDPCTGEPEGVPVPEHLMLQMLNGAQELSAEELLYMIWAMYEQYVGEESAYQSKAAFERAWQYNGHLFEQLRKTLAGAKDGKICLLSQAEREQRRAELCTLDKVLYEL
jgi:GNAT superfamily N-acetyltransferase